MGSPPPVSDPCPSADVPLSDPIPVSQAPKVLKRRYWHITDIPLVVNEWSPEMIQERPNLSMMPLWVDLKGVPGHLFSHIGLRFLADITGNFVKMLKRRYWHIADIPLVVNEWSLEMIQERPNLSVMPLWVDLKGVPGHLFSHIGLRFLADITGNFVKMHPNTEHCIRLDVARVLVEVDLEKPLTEEICVEGESGSALLGQSTILGFLLDAMVVLVRDKKSEIVRSSPGSAGESLEVVKSLMTDLDSLKALPVVVSQSETLKIQDLVVQQGEIVEMQSIGVVEVAGKERDSEEGWSVVARRGKSVCPRKLPDYSLGMSSDAGKHK
ncbi:unnamed protein product [Arabidopsis arenosa]|uniref:DUF4283 domain-containing protein n=1 Tax=Arabidopsis arenosa TaxID=38785 RepID=A0A8S2AY82_ARAAE|nr:unnamed protein product [Arabidopsis arenosa]